LAVIVYVSLATYLKSWVVIMPFILGRFGIHCEIALVKTCKYHEDYRCRCFPNQTND